MWRCHRGQDRAELKAACVQAAGYLNFGSGEYPAKEISAFARELYREVTSEHWDAGEHDEGAKIASGRPHWAAVLAALASTILTHYTSRSNAAKGNTRMSTTGDQIIADAKALGKTLLKDAEDATLAILTKLGDDTYPALPVIMTDAEKYALDLVPSAFRGFVTAYADVAMAAIEPEAVKIAKGLWGTVLLRLQQALATA